MKKIVALLTDFGLDDNYVGIMKGVLLRINPGVQIVDICHSIKPHSVVQGALTLKSSYCYFPKKTIFLCVVDPGVGSKREAIVVKAKGYVFVAPDNGLLSLVVGGKCQREIYRITNPRYFIKPVSNTFHGRDIFAPIAAHIASGVPLHKFGKKKEDLKKIALPKPRFNLKKRCITGEVIDIDHFGNCITNIKEEDLAEFKGRLRLSFNGKAVSSIVSSYAQAKEGKPLAIIGSKGYLEVSINKGSAAKGLNAAIGSRIKISGGLYQGAREYNRK